MSFWSSVGLRPWLQRLPVLCLMACSQVSQSQFSTLYSFSAFNASFANTDGGYPVAGLIQANDGNLYGTTRYGGANGNGTVFRITTGGTLTTIYSFSALSGTDSDGANPVAALIQASDGNLYGTTEWGGTYGNGTVFRITTGGTLTTLHSFTGGNDGGYPEAGLIQASDGNLYGTAFDGGVGGGGTVFRTTTGGALTTLYSFSGTSDGAEPNGLIQASDGDLYGTTRGGGTGGNGAVFRIAIGGVFTTLYSFSSRYTNPDGAIPLASLIQASDGDLYGTTYLGGANGVGTVFRITTGGALTTLYSFGATNTDGEQPYLAGLIQANDRNLYGTTVAGGVGGSGTVFRITTGGTLTTLYSFSATSSSPPYGNTDGANPWAGLIQASDGNLYGTCANGGTNDNGTVYQFVLTILEGVRLAPESVVGGKNSTATITLANPAPPSGAVVNLSSSSTAAQPPATVTIPAGQTSATATVATIPVSSSTTAVITATCAGSSASATLTITPPTVSSIRLNPSRVVGGISSTATVTLSGPAPSGGATVSLSSNSTSASPSDVSIAAGQSSGTATVTTIPVSSNTNATITASYLDSSSSAVLTITPPRVSKIKLNPSRVVGGFGSTATVTLSGPAPSGGATVSLSSSWSYVLTNNVSITAGQTSGTSLVITTPVSTNTKVTITASYAGSSAAATLIVLTTYTVTPSAGANGTISPDTPRTVNSGGSVSFTATPAANYVVAKWQVDGKNVKTGGTTYTLSNVKANHTVNVTFKSG